MIEYLKIIITAFISGITAPLPVSSSAHFNFLSNVLGTNANNIRMSFFYSFYMLAFSLVIFVTFRKVFYGCVKSAFVSKKNIELYERSKGYRLIGKNILFSLIPTIVLLIPVTKERLLMDYIEEFMNINGLILAGFACVTTACILIVALWYTAKTKGKIKSTTDKKSVLRYSFYQLPCYIIPGFSHIAAGSVNLLINDCKIKTLVSEIYVYLAPSMLALSLIKVIRALISGVLFDPLALILGVVFFAVAARVVIGLTTKVNLRRLLGFFCGYSFVFGIFIAVTSFYI